MKIEPNAFILFQEHVSKHRGVFSYRDLRNLFLTSNPTLFNRKLQPLLRGGFLVRFCRGFYVAKNFDLRWLSQRICPDSALSFGTILSQEMMIGSIPSKTIYAVKKGRTKIYTSTLGRIVQLGIPAHLWFGYDHFTEGVRQAEKEKAFLDTLYFYQKGFKFSFNVYFDIDKKLLDFKKVKKYLSRYKNPKFIKFVEGVLYD